MDTAAERPEPIRSTLDSLDVPLGAGRVLRLALHRSAGAALPELVRALEALSNG